MSINFFIPLLKTENFELWFSHVLYKEKLSYSFLNIKFWSYHKSFWDLLIITYHPPQIKKNQIRKLSKPTKLQSIVY